MRKYILGSILCLTLGTAYGLIGTMGTAAAAPGQPSAAQTGKSSDMVCQADAPLDAPLDSPSDVPPAVPAGAPEPVPCNNTEEIWCDGNTLVSCSRTPDGYFIKPVKECGDGTKCEKMGEGVYGCVMK